MSGPTPAQRLIATRAETALRGDSDGTTVITTGPRRVQIEVRRDGQSYQASHVTHWRTQVAQVTLPGTPPVRLEAPDAGDLFTWGLHSAATTWDTLNHAAARWPKQLELLCSLLSAWIQSTYGGHESGRYAAATFAQIRRENMTPVAPGSVVITVVPSGGTHRWTVDHPDWTFEAGSLDSLRQSLMLYLGTRQD